MSNLHSEQTDPQIHYPRSFAAASAGEAAWKDEREEWTFETRNILPNCLAIVDNTAAPPVEANGLIYILDATGSSHTNWDGAAANSWVRFNSTDGVWNEIAAFEGATCYDQGTGRWVFYDANAWVPITAPSVATSITAYATGGQANATQLTAEFSDVTVVGTNGDSAKLFKAKKRRRFFVSNSDAAQYLDLFPASGDNFKGLAANTAQALPAGTYLQGICFTDGEWFVFA